MKEISLEHSAKTKGVVSTVDDCDFDEINRHVWYIHPAGSKTGLVYASRLCPISQKRIFMHRSILSAGDDLKVDHVNGNGLNNQRHNLRLCDHSHNLANSKMYKNNRSGYRGVWFTGSRKSPWAACARHGGKTHHLGWFSNKEDAARAYDVAAVRFSGPYATLNFPSESIGTQEDPMTR